MPTLIHQPLTWEICLMGSEVVHKTMKWRYTYMGGFRVLEGKEQILVGDGYKEFWVDAEEYTLP